MVDIDMLPRELSTTIDPILRIIYRNRHKSFIYSPPAVKPSTNFYTEHERRRGGSFLLQVLKILLRRLRTL